MAKTDFRSVDDYIASHPEHTRAILQRVRRAIRRAVPGVEESISYQIPAYKLRGSVVLYFAGWKAHYSLYPASERLVAAFKAELTPFKVSKSTIRFSLSLPVPAKLIERVARFRAKEAADRGKLKQRSERTTGTRQRRKQPNARNAT